MIFNLVLYSVRSKKLSLFHVCRKLKRHFYEETYRGQDKPLVPYLFSLTKCILAVENSTF